MEGQVRQRALEAVFATPWAIHPPYLQTIVDIAARANEVPEAVAARLGRKLDNTQTAENRDGIAIVPVSGPIFRYANLFTELSGASSIEVFARDFNAALNDPSVKGIILAIDSPGGEANGINEAAQMVYDARGKKPIVAYVGGMAASAAYWIASATDEIVGDQTAMFGSIGVVFAMPDPSKRTARDIEIVSTQSPKKRLDVTTESGRAEIQRWADELATVFVGAVARNRKVTTDTVLSDFGQGSLRIGADAVASGMANRIGSFESLVAELKSRNAYSPVTRPASTGALEMDDMKILDELKRIVGMAEKEAPAETIAPIAPTIETEAIAAQLEVQLKRGAELEAQATEAKALAESERTKRVDAEVDAFMKEHDSKFGKESRDAFRDMYRVAKLDANAEAVARLERFADSLPVIGAIERLTPGGPNVEAVVARAAGEPAAPHAAHFETLSRLARAGAKQSDADWQSKYSTMLATVNKEMGNVS